MTLEGNIRLNFVVPNMLEVSQLPLRVKNSTQVLTYKPSAEFWLKRILGWYGTFS